LPPHSKESLLNANPAAPGKPGGIASGLATSRMVKEPALFGEFESMAAQNS
jgi:hypothetical protein